MTRPAPARKRANHSAKPYAEMSPEELAAATQEFEAEFVGESFGPLTPRQKALWSRAKRKRGRPRTGQGVRVISVSLEKGLLLQVDALAKKTKAKRAELISQGLRAILDGRVPVSAD